ncbi:MAG: hypothetical protein QE484_09895 [Rhizobium sp.]|nr:hypothetical protein [Rhizobium sp.]
MTAWLFGLFSSGWISGVAITVLWTVTGIVAMRSANPRPVLASLAPNAVSGSALLAAFGLAIREAHVLWLACLLTVALVAFLVDLRIRLAGQASGLSRRTD